MRIYTRTGDKGMTSLYVGGRKSKASQIFNVLGTTDELSSSLGLAREYCLFENKKDNSTLIQRLFKIQCKLQELNSSVATQRDDNLTQESSKQSSSNLLKQSSTVFDPTGNETKELERWIDEYDAELPALKSFILPVTITLSGGFASSSLHMARAIARKAERDFVALNNCPECENMSFESSVGIYLNRLSDFLFMAARVAAKNANQTEEIYIKEGVNENK